MYETSKILTVIQQNKIIAAILFMAMTLPFTAAIVEETAPTKYVAPNGDSITFYPNGNFFIDQDKDIGGTYTESSASYEITYSTTGFGATIKKCQNGIEVPLNGNEVEFWAKA